MVLSKTILDCLPDYAQPRQSWLSDRGNACKTIPESFKTIFDCLTEGALPRQLDCLAERTILPRQYNCLTELWIVLLALKLSFCCVLCLQGNLKLSCPFHFVFATYNCLVFQLSYKYKCFAYKYGIASFIFSVHSLCIQSICKAFKLFVTCLIVISTVFCALITRLF